MSILSLFWLKTIPGFQPAGALRAAKFFPEGFLTQLALPRFSLQRPAKGLTMATQHCKQYYISGTVQGVWFRAATQDKARELGILGWVKNLSDGRVKVCACGDKQQLQQLESWLWQGPTAAKVTAVQTEDMPEQTFTDFSII